MDVDIVDSAVDGRKSGHDPNSSTHYSSPGFKGRTAATRANRTNDVEAKALAAAACAAKVASRDLSPLSAATGMLLCSLLSVLGGISLEVTRNRGRDRCR